MPIMVDLFSTFCVFQMPEYLPEDSETDKADDKVRCLFLHIQ